MVGTPDDGYGLAHDLGSLCFRMQNFKQNMVVKEPQGPPINLCTKLGASVQAVGQHMFKHTKPTGRSTIGSSKSFDYQLFNVILFVSIGAQKYFSSTR